MPLVETPTFSPNIEKFYWKNTKQNLLPLAFQNVQSLIVKLRKPQILNQENATLILRKMRLTK